MKIERILTKRCYQKRTAYQLVYEWEDCFKQALGAKFVTDTEIGRLARTLGALYEALPLGTRKNSLAFEMNPADRITSHNNRANIVPLLIDFYLYTPEELQLFYEKYSNHKLVLISSKQVYDYLQSVGCPLNIAHLGLSIKDELRISADTTFEKDLDFVLIGRQNPVLEHWLEQYQIKHGKLRVAKKRIEKGHFNYYIGDELVGCADSREDCLALLRRSRIGLYSTKGLDDDYKFRDTHGFSQVTPRFLEYIVTGNHVLARYEDNSDVRFYEMARICPSLNTYEEFEDQLDKCLITPVDMKLYSDYMAKHYTSARIETFRQIIKEI